jgi:hypothetical protein
MNPMEQDPREDKLPKWAQDQLATLRRKVTDAERRAEEARLASGPEDSDTFLHPHDEIPVRLGRGEPVRFQLGENYFDYLDVRIKRDRRDGPYLELMSGGGVLALRPQVSNVVRVRVDER